MCILLLYLLKNTVYSTKLNVIISLLFSTYCTYGKYVVDNLQQQLTNITS